MEISQKCEISIMLLKLAVGHVYEDGVASNDIMQIYSITIE